MSLTARLMLAVLAFGLLSAGFVFVAMDPSSVGLTGAQGPTTRVEPDEIAGLIEEIEAAQLASVLEPMAALVQLGPEQSGVDVLAGSEDPQAFPTAPLSGEQLLAALNSTGTVFWVSGKADRSSPKGLDGATVGTTAYIFLQTDLKPKVVRFWIDDLRHTGTPDQIERNAPYDAGGGPALLPNPVKLAAGKHTMTAVVELTNGQKKGFSATFTVGSVSAPVAGQAPATTTTAAAPSTTATPTTTTVRTTTTTAAATGSKPAGAIEIRPGDSVASKVSGAGNGATFYFQPGTYLGVSIEPKSGQTFVAASGVILKGNGKQYAFRSGASDVTIQGFTIENYSPPKKQGVVSGQGARDWTVRSNEIRNNDEVGVSVYSGWRVLDNYIHHNGRYGLNGSGSGILVSGNEIANNATDGASVESGGTKFIQITNLTLRDNYVHNNSGSGLWTDINAQSVVFEGNRVVSNTWNGIHVELSCNVTIRNNRVEGNGKANRYPAWMNDAGILVVVSNDVTVTGNTVTNNAKGIGGIHADRGGSDITRCSADLKNLNVTGNIVTQSGGAAAGLDATADEGSVWSNWGNKFHGNTFHLSSGARFRWEGGWADPSDWSAAGMS